MMISKQANSTPYGQIIIVNKICYSYLHMKSGAVCPQADDYGLLNDKLTKAVNLNSNKCK